jgi:hypothetical protein
VRSAEDRWGLFGEFSFETAVAVRLSVGEFSPDLMITLPFKFTFVTRSDMTVSGKLYRSSGTTNPISSRLLSYTVGELDGLYCFVDSTFYCSQLEVSNNW